MALPALDAQQRKNLIYGTVLVAVAAFGYFNWVYSPRSAEVASLQAQVDTLQAKNAEARARTRGPGGDIETTLELYRRQLEVVEGLIPSSEELPDLLDAISAEAQRTGVELTLIQPVGATEEAYYTRRVYDLAVRGRYHDIGEFLTRVASLPRIVTPLNLTLSLEGPAAAGAPAPAPAARRPGAQEEEGPPRLEARFSIETYVIPTEAITDASAE